MSNEIKVGDKVRVREDAPRMYLRTMSTKFLGAECEVFEIIDGNAAIASGCDYIAIPTKYLVKVEEEKKEGKFKVGQFAMFKGRRVEIIGYSEHYPQMYRVFVLTENYHTDAKESDLEPYTEPSLEKDPSDMTEETANNLSNVLEGYCNTMQSIADNFDWQKYTADLAKEVALKVANRYNDPEEVADYAVKVAKAVVEGLKRK